MKKVIVLALALASSATLASGFITGESSFISYNNGGQQQLQVTVSGKAAEALYASLTDVREGKILEEHTGSEIGRNKTGRNISCTQMYGHTSCDLLLDAAGNVSGR